MNVLHVNSEKSWRGGEQQLAYLIEGLGEYGVNSIVVCQKKSALERYCIDRSVKHISLNLRYSLNFHSVFVLIESCRKFNIDIVHVNSGTSQNIATIASLIGNDTPIVLSRRVAFPIKNNLITVWKYNYSGLKRIICISETVKKNLYSVVTSHDKVSTVYSGIEISKFNRRDSQFREKFKINNSEVVIGNISALSPSKDLKTFIDVAQCFQKYNIPNKFLIIGEGSERKVLENYIQDKRLQDIVILTGFVKNINQIIPEIDIFATTTLMEGLGTSILDAFACRVPVVSTRAGGTTETVLHEITGMLSDLGDSETMSENIRRLCVDPNFKEDLVNRAFNHLNTNFTKEKMVKGTYSIYKSILNHK